MARVNMASYCISNWRVVFCKTWPIKLPGVMVNETTLFFWNTLRLYFQLKAFLAPEKAEFPELPWAIIPNVEEFIPQPLSVAHAEQFGTISRWKDFLSSKKNWTAPR